MRAFGATLGRRRECARTLQDGKVMTVDFDHTLRRPRYGSCHSAAAIIAYIASSRLFA